MSTITSDIPKQSLAVEELHAYYGQSHVLHGINLYVRPSEIVALLGRNGVGKTTTLRSIAGLIDRTEGHITCNQVSLNHMPTWRIAQTGVVYVPSGRRSFARLTVLENLKLSVPARERNKDQSVQEVLDVFPGLKERLTAVAGVLSGGQNQMLKMARALLTKPQFLLLDEPTEGLAPNIVHQMGEHIVALREHGVGVLLAEQNSRFALSLSQRLYILDKGSVQIERSGENLYGDKEIRQYLGV